MMNKIFFLLYFIVFSVSTNAQSGASDLSAFIDSSINNAFVKEKIPGVLVGILDNGQKRYFNAGFAVPDKQRPFDSTAVFEIGSITKTFTAYVLTAVLMENKISETESILKYLPDSVQQNKNLNSISFLSLMNHSSGLSKLPDNLNLISLNPYDDYDADMLFSFLKSCKPKPDGKSNYSNLGAGLAGVLASHISGKTYDALINQYINAPFGMNKKSGNNKQNISQGYFSATNKINFWNMDILAPCGGLKYNADQMLSYLQHMCLPKSKKEKVIINKLITQSVSINKQQAVGRAWQIIAIEGQQPVFWHNGGTYGFSTFCAFEKKAGKAVLVVINQADKNNVSDVLGFRILKKLISEN